MHLIVSKKDLVDLREVLFEGRAYYCKEHVKNNYDNKNRRILNVGSKLIKRVETMLEKEKILYKKYD